MNEQIIPGKPTEPIFPLTAFNDKPNCFDYGVRAISEPVAIGEPPKPTRYEAILPYRQIVWYGDSEGAVIGAMLKGVAELARKGALDPEAPYRKGVPPLQHAMKILDESLLWHIERRREQIESDGQRSPDQPGAFDVESPQPSGRLNRLNEIISGLATSIAALARVKEL